jgi:polysaccharide export outer membrane protein
MNVSLRTVFALVFASALCCAQNETPSSSGTSAGVKEAPSAAIQAPANPPQIVQDNAVAPAPQAAVSASDQLPPTRKPDADGKAPAEKAAASPAGKKPPYVLGPLDVISVRVWNNPNLTSPLDIGSDGMISMPLIGQVKADGLTAQQLKQALAERLGEFLNSPEVDVQVLKVNSKRYYVYGGVGHPGEFPLVQETTIMDALSSVAGFRDFANTKKIYVLRGSQKFNFNYKDVSKGKNMEQNILLQNGDRIFVPE